VVSPPFPQKKLRDDRPEDLIRFAVKGMLPKNRLGRAMIKKLKVYAGDAHPHEAQQPEPLAFQ
jgi:large subunit ribosomal protein L13